MHSTMYMLYRHTQYYFLYSTSVHTNAHVLYTGNKLVVLGTSLIHVIDASHAPQLSLATIMLAHNPSHHRPTV